MRELLKTNTISVRNCLSKKQYLKDTKEEILLLGIPAWHLSISQEVVENCKKIADHTKIISPDRKLDYDEIDTKRKRSKLKKEK